MASKQEDKYFMPFEERKCILENLSMVDDVYDFVDDEIDLLMDLKK